MMLKLKWREVTMFAVALLCATGALVAAGLAEGADMPATNATRSGAPAR